MGADRNAERRVNAIEGSFADMQAAGALRDQLGLDLRRQRVAVELLVIRYSEEPSAN